MIVPSDRLLGVVGVVLLPLAVLVAAVPTTEPLVLGVGGVVLLLAGLDAAQAWRTRTQVRAGLPELVRMQKNREAGIEVRLQNLASLVGREREITVGLAWPPEFRVERETVTVRLPAGEEGAKFIWNSLATVRGKYFFREIWLEAASALGWWRVRESQPAVCEVRVYPNLFEDRQAAAALFLNRGRFGMHAQRQAGKGRDFEKLRDYAHGDPLDEVHWKASARRGKLVSKVFQVERTQEIYVILDASRLSARQDALERLVTSGLLLALAAEQQGDLFGMLAFDDQVRAFVRAKNGMAHFDTCREALYTLQARPVSPDFEEVCAFIRTRLRKRALLLFLTALDDPALAESFQRGLALLTGQHLVLVNMLRPDGVQPLFTGDDPDAPDALYARLGGHLRWSGLRELEKKLRRQGATFRLLEHERLALQLVNQYLEVKGRQLL